MPRGRPKTIKPKEDAVELPQADAAVVGLTEAEKAFANHYIFHGNGSGAYKHAFPDECEGKDKDWTTRKGSALLKLKRIQKYINYRNRPGEEIVEELSKDVALDPELPLGLRLDAAKLLDKLSQKDQTKTVVEKFWKISASIGALAQKPIPREVYDRITKRNATPGS